MNHTTKKKKKKKKGTILHVGNLQHIWLLQCGIFPWEPTRKHLFLWPSWEWQLERSSMRISQWCLNTVPGTPFRSLTVGGTKKTNRGNPPLEQWSQWSIYEPFAWKQSCWVGMCRLQLANEMCRLVLLPCRMLTTWLLLRKPRCPKPSLFLLWSSCSRSLSCMGISWFRKKEIISPNQVVSYWLLRRSYGLVVYTTYPKGRDIRNVTTGTMLMKAHENVAEV